MKKILIPTDFSNCANAASDYAINLAQKAKGEVHFLHLLSTPIDWVKLPKTKEKQYPEILKAIGNAKNKLLKWIKKAEKKGVKAHQSLAFNEGIQEIISDIENHQYDFVIMGSHGAKGFKEKLIGSHAQRIIRHATIPVIIVKQPILKPIKNILFVSDFKDVSRASFHTLTQFADLIDAHIDLLFINTPEEFKMSVEIEENMKRVLVHCQRDESCTKNVINASSIEEGIIDFCKKKDIDLIAICTHGKGGIFQLFSPSIAETIANHIELPLLSIKL